MLKAYGITRAADIDLRDLAFDRKLVLRAAPIRGSEGRLIRRNEWSIATVDSAIRHDGKRRFVAAHELGHHELHRDAPVFVCDGRDFLDWHRRRPQETEANRFAAELLMPKAAFCADAHGARSLASVGEVADAYRASLTAAAFRFVHLDVAPSALVFCVGGRVEWSLISPSFSCRYVERGRAVHPYSGAGEAFSSGATSRGPEPTPVTAWFSDDDLDPSADVYEDCLAMPSLDATLSLILDP
ncbi:ImmA/IrrE family metallo-endopeptidase [Rubricoccus marinus]|uniref:IrrE N-terminal-like domain-containing protein n=1 Tax=Rubricoccus marinus TaxID=716817 RepID=A0A259TU64_9BACT|nr:ImmA/IrrE family metallo-endopeptidase [Rubricoccus marinus]OZC01289.1 hypothetical protein BSZ36_17735 [Rubricoccus marinus]